MEWWIWFLIFMAFFGLIQTFILGESHPYDSEDYVISVIILTIFWPLIPVWFVIYWVWKFGTRKAQENK